MMNLKKILSHSLLALALGACGAAFAGPSYHVTVDTRSLGSGTGYLDLGLGADTGAAPTSATLSSFSGAFGNDAQLYGDASGSVAGSLMLKNDQSYSDLFQQVQFGGLFGFDIRFDGNADNGGNPIGTSFFASLYNLDALYVAAEIDLLPGQADVLSAANAYGSISTNAVSAVPEPSTLLSMVTGLGLVGFGLRRRAR
jgi:hypothetical protein